MSISDVEQAVRQVQRHVFQFEPNAYGSLNVDAPANNHETSTRYIIIDPILRALGWDLSDPGQCVVEYRIQDKQGKSGFIDYALLNGRGEPVILVEAKRIGEYSDSDDNFDQMDRYLESVETAMVCVVTNGQFWEIWLLNERDWQPESEKPLGLHWRDVNETAERLYKHLARRPRT